MNTHSRRTLLFLIALALTGAQPAALTPGVRQALTRISPDELRTNLAFLASDKLEGRDTPSRGLDLAAGYIAGQLRSAAVEPAGDDGYFQTAHMFRTAHAALEMRLHAGSRTLETDADEAVGLSMRALDLSAVPLFRVDTAADLRPGDWHGRAVLTTKALENLVGARHPAAIVELARDYEAPRLMEAAPVALVIVKSGDAFDDLSTAPPGDTGWTISLKQSAPTLVPVVVRNVIGMVRGSDPKLRGQYVLLTAHYDHLGRNPDGAIYPGANDDGSGTVSAIQIGKALAALHPHPKRSVVVMLLFGEEEGSLGALYYVHHPVFPLANTVADLNLEQLGRTDSSDGPEVASASLTGFDYSNIAETLQQAGALTGVRIYKTADDADYFKRSDNATFADSGIPAHTIVVAYEFPDYHAAGDVWQKIDFANMAKVDRMIALGTILLADSPQSPQWHPK